MQHRSREAGFTLIELILVIVLIGITAGSTAMLVLQGTQSYADLIERKESLHNARLAMERISREVRQASNASTVSASRLRINGGLLEFFHDAATSTVKIGGTSQPAEGRILADGVGSLTFTMDNSNDWVSVNLTEASGLKYRTKVYLRKEIFYP
jgi:MSHA biogenesis protein MshO